VNDATSAASAQASPDTAQIVTDEKLSPKTETHESFGRSEHFGAAQASLAQIQPISHNSYTFLPEHVDISCAVHIALW
jgi:hypothetical protein